MPDLSIENKKRQLNFNTIAGIDEAGRGPWAGPVYSAIVILNKDRIPKGINDSKKVSEKKRMELYEEILLNHECGIGFASPEAVSYTHLTLPTKA